MRSSYREVAQAVTDGIMPDRELKLWHDAELIAVCDDPLQMLHVMDGLRFANPALANDETYFVSGIERLQ